MTNTDYLVRWEPIGRARLGPTDISKFLRVSRVTASLWLNGHTSPTADVVRVNQFIDAVDKAYESGDLPVPFNVPRRERRRYIETVINRHLAR